MTFARSGTWKLLANINDCYCRPSARKGGQERAMGNFIVYSYSRSTTVTAPLNLSRVPSETLLPSPIWQAGHTTQLLSTPYLTSFATVYPRYLKLSWRGSATCTAVMCSRSFWIRSGNKYDTCASLVLAMKPSSPAFELTYS